MQTLSTQRTPRRSARDGFTLMEILLVLALLIVLSAVIWPALGGFYAGYRVEQAASDVQILLSAARIRAAEAGTTYQFRYEPGGRRYLLIPANTAELVAASDSPLADAATEISAARRQTGELPETVTFGQPSSESEAGHPIPAALLEGLIGADDLQRAPWGPEILFYPDGTASDAEFTVFDEDGESITLTVRGLTGAVKSATTETEDQ